MKRILLFAGFTATLIFSSCKKDKGGPGGETAGKPLKRITRTTNGNGEITVFDLTYSTSGQLLSIISTDHTEKTTFTYDAAGRVTGFVEEDEEAKATYSFTYSNGIPISGIYKRFLKHYNQPDEFYFGVDLTYTVANNLVTKIQADYGAVQKEYTLSYSNGKLIKFKNEPGTAFYEVNYTYGNQKPPFPKVFDFILDVYGRSSLLLYGSNNEIRTTTFNFGGPDLPYAIDYSYDINGNMLTMDDFDGQHWVFEY